MSLIDHWESTGWYGGHYFLDATSLCNEQLLLFPTVVSSHNTKNHHETCATCRVKAAHAGVTN